MADAIFLRRVVPGLRLVSISITTPPTKTQYIAGQSISLTGMVVTATFSDGSTADVTGDCTFSPSVATAGVTGVTASYFFGGRTKTATQPITVVAPSAVLSENTPEVIALVAAAGMAQSFWSVGDEIVIPFTTGDIAVRIIDFNKDDLHSSDPRYSDPTYNLGTKKTAITFEMKDLYQNQRRMNATDINTTGWDTSEMRTSNVPSIMGNIPSEWTTRMRLVSVKTATSGSNSTIRSTADYLWLLSEIQVFGNRSYSHAGEGARYAYYTAGNSQVKSRSGSAGVWWLRSPTPSASVFARVGSNGAVGTATASTVLGVSLCFGF